MSCCSPDMFAESGLESSAKLVELNKENELRQVGVKLNNGSIQYVFSSPSIHCGSCIQIIEKELSQMAGVENVRVNLSLKRIALTLKSEKIAPMQFVRRLEQIGFSAMPVDFGDTEETLEKKQSAKLLQALAVAGFAAMNIMLLSVSTWSGATGVTRDLFHLISAMIAIPAVAFSGQVFFVSAWQAIRNKHINMDVPISLAVLLALGMSLFETYNKGEIAYFDAAVSLLFFLLIGRYLDQRMRERARGAVNSLSLLASKGGSVIKRDGTVVYSPIDEIEAGMKLRILPGDKIPVDGIICAGNSDLDLSLVTGESKPIEKSIGSELQAGTINLTGVLEIIATKAPRDSYLAEVSKMMDAAQNGRGTYVRLADRMAQLYAPAVHLLALLAFVFWMVSTNGDWHTSIYVAISVLIITCPCALGLAVPVVHVIGSGRLFEEGILMKDGSALERLREINHVIFDKTGTLTTDLPSVIQSSLHSELDKQLAAALAKHSSHPVAKAVAGHFGMNEKAKVSEIREVSGQGIEGVVDGKRIRLGKQEWVNIIVGTKTAQPSNGNLFFAIEGSGISWFEIEQNLRDGAKDTITSLSGEGLAIEILSGDGVRAVAAVAGDLGIETFKAEQTPADKISRINSLQALGGRVLMVGDGLNDAPSLAAAHVSMAPASASDIGRSASDFVFTRNNLNAISFARSIAAKADHLIKTNFGLAILYNLIAVPLAFAGLITPLYAAIAMSVSSIIVVLNSMRLMRRGKSGLAISSEFRQPILVAKSL